MFLFKKYLLIVFIFIFILSFGKYSFAKSENKQILRNWENKIKNAKKEKIEINSKAVKIENYKYIFAQIFINPKKYDIVDILVNSERPPFSPKCFLKDRILIYFPIEDEKEIELVVYYTDKNSLKNLEKYLKINEKLQKMQLPKFKKIQTDIKILKFTELKAKIEKKDSEYYVKLPVSVEAFVIYNSYKKYFPKDGGCYKSEMKVKKLPDEVYIRLLFEEDNTIMIKNFKVY